MVICYDIFISFKYIKLYINKHMHAAQTNHMWIIIQHAISKLHITHRTCILWYGGVNSWIIKFHASRTCWPFNDKYIFELTIYCLVFDHITWAKGVNFTVSRWPNWRVWISTWLCSIIWASRQSGNSIQPPKVEWSQLYHTQCVLS